MNWNDLQPDLRNKVSAALRAQGVPRSSIEGIVAQMSATTVTILLYTLDESGRATPVTRACYQHWRSERKARVREHLAKQQTETTDPPAAAGG